MWYAFFGCSQTSTMEPFAEIVCGFETIFTKKPSIIDLSTFCNVLNTPLV